MTILKNIIYKIIIFIFGRKIKNTSIYLKYLRCKYRSRKSNLQLDIVWNNKKFDKLKLINYLISTIKNDDINYLEISCQNCSSIHSVEIKKKKIIPPDEFHNFKFNQNDKFDLIFLDGNHSYLQLRKDATKAFTLLKKGGWILFHYCIPRNWLEEHVPRIHTGNWIGDCWKFGYELSFMNTFKLATVKIDYGICIVPFSGNYFEVPDFSKTFEFANKTSNYDFFIKNKHRLNIKSWEEALKWINTCQKFY